MKRASSATVRALRAFRIVGLSIGIYQCGYQSGIADTINDPKGMSEKILKGVLEGNEATGESDNMLMKRQCRHVGKRVLISCKDYCLQKLLEEQAKAAKKEEELTLEDNNSNANEVEKWKQAIDILRRHDWTFIVIDASSANAFVNRLQPGKVFVHEGLFHKLKPSDDELALILSHELAHVIHQHADDSSTMNYMLSIVQLALFSLVDPTGLTPFLFDVLLKNIGSGMENFYSREHETEADLTGIEIAAHACFDTKSASEVFARLSDFDESSDWNSTHPNGVSRTNSMREASVYFNPEALGDKCKKMKGLLQDMKDLLGMSRSSRD